MRTIDERTNFAYAAAIVGGAVIWLAASALGGRTEAWVSPFYWTVAYPLSICLAGGLGGSGETLAVGLERHAGAGRHTGGHGVEFRPAPAGPGHVLDPRAAGRRRRRRHGANPVAEDEQLARLTHADQAKGRQGVLQTHFRPSI